ADSVLSARSCCAEDSAHYSASFLFVRHWDEANGQGDTFFQLTVFLFEQIKLLREPITDGNDHASALFELIGEQLRNFIRRACHNDRIEWRIFRPTFVTIADLHVHIPVAETLKRSLGALGKWLDNFNCVNLAREFRKNRSLITRTGANLHNPIS